MPEQIVDLIEAVMPGPQGVQGPQGAQGLPGVNGVENDQAVAGYVISRGSHTSSALEARYAPRDPRDTMVVFGDSMTECGSSPAKQWWSIVASRLGLKAKSYGHGGSGFVAVNAGITYDTELTRAIADTSVDRTKVKYVFVNGSTNDAQRASEAAAAAATWSERCMAAYPNAQFVAFPGLSGMNVRHAANAHRLMNHMRQFCLVGQTLAADGWQVFTNSPFWLTYNRDLTSSDTLHPNDKGLAVIAEYVLSGLQTGVYTSLSHSMGAIKPIKLGTLTDGADKTSWMMDLISTGFCGSDHADAVYPMSNLTSTYAAWQALPDINSAVFYFCNLQTRLDADQIQRFTTSSYTVPKSVSGASEDRTVSVGLDIPLCPLPYPFGMVEAHGEAISRWSDGLDVRINSVPGALNAYLYQSDTSPALDTPTDARYWLWLHFDCLPYVRYNFWGAPSRNTAASQEINGAMGLYNLANNVSPTNRLLVSVSGRIIIPIAGLWRP